jgi:hypothetical protein
MAARILLAMLRTVMTRVMPSVDTNSAVVILGRQSISQIAANHLVIGIGESAITVPCRNPVWYPQRAHSQHRRLVIWCPSEAPQRGQRHSPALYLFAR